MSDKDATISMIKQLSREQYQFMMELVTALHQVQGAEQQKRKVNGDNNGR